MASLPLRLVGLVVASVLAVAACGPEELASPSGPTEAPLPTPSVTRYELNTTVWYAGMIVSFGSATAIFDPTGGTVTILARITNPATDDRSFDAPIRITAQAQGFDPVHGTELPLVPAGGATDVLLTYDVPGLPSVDDAVIRVGSSESNQAIVPFGNGPVAVATLEPVPLVVKGTANAGDLRVTIRSGELRWDLPDWADELPVNVAAITVTYDATYRGSFSGGLAFSGANVSLILPDGSTVLPRKDGRSQSVTLLLPGKAQTGLSSRFEVPSGMTGTFVLRISNGSAHGAINIPIPG
jgi:hypothetical protein